MAFPFQGKGLKYLLTDVHCDAQGNFEHAQCGMMLEKPHKHGCFCIDKTKWWNHLPGPMAETRDKVDCNMIQSGNWSKQTLNEPPHDKTNKVACVPSEDSDQPGHPPSLIRVFAVCMKKAWVLSYPLSTQPRLWSDWASLCWAHMPFCWFCHEVAQMWMCWCERISMLKHFEIDSTKVNQQCTWKY